jgi:hypothetical protein
MKYLIATFSVSTLERVPKSPLQILAVQSTAALDLPAYLELLNTSQENYNITDRDSIATFYPRWRGPVMATRYALHDQVVASLPTTSKLDVEEEQ